MHGEMGRTEGWVNGRFAGVIDQDGLCKEKTGGTCEGLHDRL